MGADLYVTKPFSTRDLMAKIKRGCSGRLRPVRMVRCNAPTALRKRYVSSA